MPSQWYYEQKGAVFGPFTHEQMTELVGQKHLQETDSVWQEGDGPYGAMAAKDVFDFGATPTTLPSWLADVEGPGEASTPSLISEPVTNHEDPEWLEDLRLWVGLEVFANTQETSPTEITLSTPEMSGLPNWMEGWQAPAAPVKAPPSAPKAPVPPPAVKTPEAPPAAKTLPVAPVVKAAPVAPTPASKSFPPVASPILPPVAPVVKAPPVTTTSPTPAEKMREESGFDAETGQILDPIKFRRWQQQARIASPVSNASFLETFRKGRLAIESWIDDDRNRLRVLHAELEEIHKDAAIKAILQEAGKFGKELQDKLVHHLAFMLENRRRYYQALAGQRR